MGESRRWCLASTLQQKHGTYCKRPLFKDKKALNVLICSNSLSDYYVAFRSSSETWWLTGSALFPGPGDVKAQLNVQNDWFGWGEDRRWAAICWSGGHFKKHGRLGNIQRLICWINKYVAFSSRYIWGNSMLAVDPPKTSTGAHWTRSAPATQVCVCLNCTSMKVVVFSTATSTPFKQSYTYSFHW